MKFAESISQPAGQPVNAGINTLRLSGEYSRRDKSAVTLRAIPHVNYLKSFDRVLWNPELMGLEAVQGGFQSTLVATPAWTLEWLRKVECGDRTVWDTPVFSRAPFGLWNKFAPCPENLTVSKDFLSDGGFINRWTGEDKVYWVWGRVNAQSSSSVLSFVWLQHVLSGGKPWRRREIGFLPEEVQDELPLGYMAIPKVSSRNGTLWSWGGTAASMGVAGRSPENYPPSSLVRRSLGEGGRKGAGGWVEFYSYGLPLPLIKLSKGGFINAGGWMGVKEKARDVPADEIEAVIIPCVQKSENEKTIFALSKNNLEPLLLSSALSSPGNGGVCWLFGPSKPSIFVGL